MATATLTQDRIQQDDALEKTLQIDRARSKLLAGIPAGFPYDTITTGVDGRTGEDAEGAASGTLLRVIKQRLSALPTERHKWVVEGFLQEWVSHKSYLDNVDPVIRDAISYRPSDHPEYYQSGNLCLCPNAILQDSSDDSCTGIGRCG